MTKKNPKQRPASRPRSRPGRAPGGPALQTPEGDPLAFCTALYQHGSADEVIHTLARADDFDLGDGPEPGPDGALQFGWVEMGTKTHPLPAPLGRRVLANLTLTADALEIETMSEARMARCRRRLEGLLGDRLHLLRSERKSLEQALAEEEPKDGPEPLILPPEMVANLNEQMLRRWLDESIPALDGLTPRQAAQTPEGQQKLRDLIAYIERQQARNPPLPGMFSPDYRKTLKMLGVE